jgi:predicted hotdog family 3-hydroxylacyl-ACP dehydratase
MTFPAIEELLPHAPPMLWVDEVCGCERDLVRCKLTVRDDHVFVEDGAVDPLIAIEWMAQAVGALVGLWDRQNQIDPRPGFLIAIPEACLEVEQFQVGDVLIITAKRIWGDEQLASFECLVERAGVEVARAQLSVYRRALSRRPPA